MSEDELKAIEAESVGDCSNCMLLVAEVRRLREAILAYDAAMLRAPDEFNDPRHYPYGSAFWTLRSTVRR